MKVLLIAPLAVFFISFFLSMLGMGGGQLYIPLLFWLGLDFKTEAIPLGLLLNVITSSSASINYLRNSLVKLNLALPFAISMVAMAPVGALFTEILPTRIIIFAFAFFLLVAAGIAISGVKVKTPLHSRKVQVFIGLVAGGFLGFLVGCLGRGGGSFVVPVLLLLGLDGRNAAATSAFVVTFSALSGFLGHLVQGHVIWKIALLCAAAAILGSQLGSRFMIKRARGKVLKRAFAVVLACVAAKLIYDAVRMGG